MSLKKQNHRKKGSDKFKPFKGKRTLTEKEINLMKTRLNRGDIDRNDVPEIGYVCTPSQRDKGITWLRKNHRSLGYRELTAIGATTDKHGDIIRDSRGKPKWKTTSNSRMKLIDWYPQYNPYTGKVIFHYPVYEIRGFDSSFQYFVKGGEIHLVG